MLFGTLNILESMRKLDISAPLLYSSTNKVYGKMDDVEVSEHESFYSYKNLPHGVPESFPLEFYSPYGCSKGSADQYVLDYSRIFGLKTIVFRQKLHIWLQPIWDRGSRLGGMVYNSSFI